MTKESPIQDVLVAVRGISQQLEVMDQRFDGIDQRLDGMDHRLDGMDQRFDRMEKRMGGMDSRFDQIDARFEATDKRLDDLAEAIYDFATHVDLRFDEVHQKIATMVTKDYLDEKLADLRADLVLLARKGNMKFAQLVDELVERGSLAPKAAKRILALEPFPQG